MMPVRTRLVVASALGVVVVSGIALIARPWLQLGAMYPWRAAAAFAAMMAISRGYLGGHHPFQRLGPANGVTLVRAMLLALVAALIGEPKIARVAWAAVVLGGTITLLDGVDGWLARRTGMASDFGARFDMETDALLILALSVLVWQHGKAGVWVLGGGVLRYAFVAAGWLLPWMTRTLRPTLRGRTIAVAHMVGLSVALGPIIPAPLSAIAAAITLAALVWSFAVDVRRLWRTR